MTTNDTSEDMNLDAAEILSEGGNRNDQLVLSEVAIAEVNQVESFGGGEVVNGSIRNEVDGE